MPSNRDPLQNEQSVYSIGTAFAIDGFERYIRTPGIVKPSLLAINVGTLMRNCINSDPDMTMREMSKRIRTELHVLTEDVASMMMYIGTPNPSMLLYINDYYKFIPPEVARPIETSKARKRMYDATRYGISNYRELFGLINSIPGFTIKFDIFQRATPPHKHLLTLFRSMSPSRNVMMISHVALDYHVYGNLTTFLLLESHTVQIRVAKDLGKKIFDREHIPFNAQTHALLGDKDYLKSPLSNKQRKDLYTLAESRNWEVRTKREIRSDINKLGYPILIPLD